MINLLATHGGVDVDHIFFFILALVGVILAAVDVVRSRASSLTSDACLALGLVLLMMWWP